MKLFIWLNQLVKMSTFNSCQNNLWLFAEDEKQVAREVPMYHTDTIEKKKEKNKYVIKRRFRFQIINFITILKKIENIGPN